MDYRERPTAAPGVVLWQGEVGPAPTATVPGLVLPDGCLDLLWDGRRLVVAGPDTVARRHDVPVGASYTALRCAAGTGPALLGLPAHEVRDASPALEDLWPARAARQLQERVAADPARALEAWALARAPERPADPLGARVLAGATAGAPVSALADRLGLSARQLHRRCLPVFGYGPRRLGRVLRLGRALDAARAGAPLLRVAADTGYADQQHLSREVRALTGTTPTALLAELRARTP